ncbi:MAG: heavy-metal-associated domain-containing protein [Pedosphaera sp.]|nr:heavy-metal-associated domain-containing protein [Pedosphaera sp.]MSU42470.1 heavy-metal-associated domain-containing protein [Pedosphaera sp.]
MKSLVLPRAFASALCAFFLTLPLLHAEEQMGTYRLIGLSAPERQEDLREVMKTVPDVTLVSLDVAKAEVSLRFDAEKLFLPAKSKQPPAPDKITERLSSLISGASKNTFSLTERSAVPADKLTKVEILIGVLDCKGCRYAAYQAIAKLDGVERATVSATPSAVIAWIDATKTKRETLEAALKKTGVELLPKL